jgi:anti-sigma factor ChrR (cupin superfamily)
LIYGEWKTISDGVKMQVRRSDPGAVRVLLRFDPGKGYSLHRHPTGEEVFVFDGIYTEMGKDCKAGS